jgi:hypothetical protein
MASLKDTAMAYSGKHEITELDKIATDLPIYESSFKNKQDQEIKYFYAELNGIKYSIKAAAMVKIKELLTLRPQTKFIKVNKNSDGQYSVIPLD